MVRRRREATLWLGEGGKQSSGLGEEGKHYCG